MESKKKTITKKKTGQGRAKSGIKIQLARAEKLTPNSSVTNVTNVTHLEPTFPSLEREKELALILFYRGYSEREIGEQLNKSHMTFCRWKKDDPVFKAHYDELKKTMQDQMLERMIPIASGMINILGEISQRKFSPDQMLNAGNLSLKVLQASGYLPKTIEKTNDDKANALIIDAFIADLKTKISLDSLEML